MWRSRHFPYCPRVSPVSSGSGMALAEWEAPKSVKADGNAWGVQRLPQPFHLFINEPEGKKP
jgi:hypothetical protein